MHQTYVGPSDANFSRAVRQPAFLPKKTSEELPGHVPHACGLMPGARGAMLGGCRVSDSARGVCAWVGGCGGIRATTVWRGGAYMCTSILHSERTNTYIRVCGHGSSTSSRAGGLDVYNLGGRIIVLVAWPCVWFCTLRVHLGFPTGRGLSL